MIVYGANHLRVGVFNGEGPPVPIPNTVVKLTSADNTWLETARKDRSTPTYKTRITRVILVFAYSSLFGSNYHRGDN